jgi:hypothetical protein
MKGSSQKKEKDMYKHLSPRPLPICVVGLFLMVLSLLSGLPTPAANGITWTPPVLTTILTPGASRSFDVSFTAPYALDHVVVDVAPELQPFVQVSPHALTRIATGQSVQVTIIVSVSTRELSGPVTGAIRLFHELHIGMKGGGVRMLRWPVPFANPLLLTIGVGAI